MTFPQEHVMRMAGDAVAIAFERDARFSGGASRRVRRCGSGGRRAESHGRVRDVRRSAHGKSRAAALGAGAAVMKRNKWVHLPWSSARHGIGGRGCHLFMVSLSFEQHRHPAVGFVGGATSAWGRYRHNRKPCKSARPPRRSPTACAERHWLARSRAPTWGGPEREAREPASVWPSELKLEHLCSARIFPSQRLKDPAAVTR